MIFILKENQLPIGVHTFTLCKELHFEEEKEVKKYFYEISRGTQKCYLEEKPIKKLVCAYYKLSGIRLEIIYYNNVHSNMKFIYLYVFVNAAKLLKLPRASICAMPMTDQNICKLKNSLNQILEGIPYTKKGLEDFRIHRLDLCADFDLKSPELVACYIKLLSRNLHEPERQVQRYDEVSKRTKPYKNSVDVQYQNYFVAIYNKQAQVEDQSDYFSEEDIQMANGLLRYEIRLERKKLQILLESQIYDCFERQLLRLKKISRCLFVQNAKSLCQRR